MPKQGTPNFPLSGLFAVYKPSGPTSQAVLDTLKPLMRRSKLFVPPEVAELNRQNVKGFGRQKRKKAGLVDVKIGQGGTLDPLASGVLVIGINKGTKHLAQFLECTKSYETIGLLGCSTDSYDALGKVVDVVPVSKESGEIRTKLNNYLPVFTGQIAQMPPIYSALKMDGKPLYYFARNGIPLPRPIEKRKCNVSELSLEWLEPNQHSFKWPKIRIDIEGRALLGQVEDFVEKAEFQSKAVIDGNEDKINLVDDAEKSQIETDTTARQNGTSSSKKKQKSEKAEPELNTQALDNIPQPAFRLKMTVSRGTYVRSIVHDLAKIIGSAAHVVQLERTRQGEFTLSDCVPWDVIARATVNSERTDEHEEWEQAILERFKPINT